MLSHVLVEEAAVYAVKDGQGSNLIEAAAIAKQGAELAASELQEHLSRLLPPYAVPTKITITGDFPRTTTGKINRRELQVRAMADANDLIDESGDKKYSRDK